MNTSVSSRFSPRTLDAAALERLTVARHELISQLQANVTNAVVSNGARFELVLGPRGIGKSHLIGVLEHRLRGSEQLRGRALIVAPPEELHPIALVQFLALLLREFPDDPELGPASDAVRSLQRQRDANQERRAVDLIRGRLAGRSLIILLENLDELFEAIGRDGQLRLRNILQTERCWSIVATSRSLIPAFTKYEAPFHGTFNMHRLEPLNTEQCRDMLATLAVAHDKPVLAEFLCTPRGLRRVRGIHHLLDGNPRAMAFMFRQLDEQRLDRFEQAIGDLADELKPYFQEQMTRLSPAQRAIVEILAESWRPLTVTEIAEQCFSSQASTSGALRLLRRDSLVQVFERGRERYYELGDPLHRLARANERPRDMIVAFGRVVRHWYGDDSDSDFMARQHQVLPASAHNSWLARDTADPTHAAEKSQIEQLLRLPPESVVAEIERRLEKDESAVLRAMLVLNFELAGDDGRAIDALYSTPGVLETETQEWLLGCALAKYGPDLDLVSSRPDSKIARAIQVVVNSSAFPDDVEMRRALLAEFDQASLLIRRLLSDLVTRSSVLWVWVRHAAWTDLGQLLARLAPTRNSPNLRVALEHLLSAAWHHRQLHELVPAGTSLEPLLEVLPKELRQWFFIASVFGEGKQDLQTKPNEVRAVLARLRELAAGDAPDAELALSDGAVMSAMYVELLDALDVKPVREHVDSAAIGTLVQACLYRWLASRRDLAPLARVASWVGDACDLPIAVLRAKNPREAVARLSEPERDLVRSILALYQDPRGLEALGLAHKPTSRTKTTKP